MAGGFNSPGPSTRPRRESCEELSITTNIATPQEQLFNQIKENEQLDVKLTNEEKSVGLFNKEGIFIGSIIDPSVVQLIECLKQGKNFTALIMEIDKAYIVVNIFYQDVK